MPGWMIHKLESRFLGEISTTSRYVDETTPMTESEKELKSLIIKVKEESEKAGLNLNIQNLRSWSPVPSVQLLSHVQLFVTPWTAAH